MSADTSLEGLAAHVGSPIDGVGNALSLADANESLPDVLFDFQYARGPSDARGGGLKQGMKPLSASVSTSSDATALSVTGWRCTEMCSAKHDTWSLEASDMASEAGVVLTPEARAGRQVDLSHSPLMRVPSMKGTTCFRPRPLTRSG